VVSGGCSEPRAGRCVQRRGQSLAVGSRWFAGSLGTKPEAKLGLGPGHAILPGASSRLASGLPARP